MVYAYYDALGGEITTSIYSVLDNFNAIQYSLYVNLKLRQ